MRHRLISKPTFFEGEAALINELFSLGLPCLHLRKPAASQLECKDLLKQIKPEYYQKIILHQHPNLMADFPLMGWHCKEGLRECTSEKDIEKLLDTYQQKGFLVGTSVHQPSNLESLCPKFDYTFLSPIFPSISKINYFPSYDWKVNRLKYPFQLIALGGINSSNLLEVSQKGFDEIAVLGAVWQDLSQVIKQYQLLVEQLIK